MYYEYEPTKPEKLMTKLENDYWGESYQSFLQSLVIAISEKTPIDLSPYHELRDAYDKINVLRECCKKKGLFCPIDSRLTNIVARLNSNASLIRIVESFQDSQNKQNACFFVAKVDNIS